MQCLLLTPLICSVATQVFQVELKRVEPLAIRMMQNGTWAGHLEEVRKELASSGQTSGREYIHELITYCDNEYLGEISVGEPRQQFQVIMDTGSSNFWVADKSCNNDPWRPEVCQNSKCDIGVVCEVFCEEKSCCVERPTPRNFCHGKRRFDAERSKTYERVEGVWEVKYNTGSCSGFFGKDTVRLGGKETDQLEVPGAIFGQAEKIALVFAYSHAEGVLGLGPCANPESRVTPPFIRATELGLVKPLFVVYFAKAELQEGATGGRITYGGYDPDHCELPFTTEPLTSSSHWQFELMAVSFKDHTIKNAWQTLSDTASAFNECPRAFLEKIAVQYDATYDPVNDVYLVPCEEDVTIGLTIGRKVYKMTSKNLLHPLYDDICMLKFFPRADTALGVEWILGAPFIREYCVLYDLEKSVIGFGKARHD